MTDDKVAARVEDSAPELDWDALKLETTLGQKQALSRNFGLFSLTSLGIVIAK